MAVDFRRQQQIERLKYLDTAQQQREDADATMNSAFGGGGRMWNGSNVSGPFGESFYRQRLNDQGEAAGLRQTLAGRRPTVNHTYAGTNFAEGPDMPAPRRSIAALAGDSETDNLGFYGRQAAVQGQQVQNERQRNAEFSESTADDPYYAGERRAIRHADIADAGTAQGEAAANAYLAPGQDNARRQQLWDAEAQAQTLGPYSAAAIKGEAEMDKAREATRRASLVALQNGDARIGAQAIRSTGAIASSRANQGQDVSATAAQVGSLMPGGQQGGDRVVTDEQLEALIRANPNVPAEQIRQHFIDKGYQVGGGNVPTR